MAEKLTPNQVEDKLVQLNKGLEAPWELVSGKLHKDFMFDNFIEAFGFMTKVAIIAQEMNHHPGWTNVFKRLHVDLITHNVAGISDLDFELASKMEAVL